MRGEEEREKGEREEEREERERKEEGEGGEGGEGERGEGEGGEEGSTVMLAETLYLLYSLLPSLSLSLSVSHTPRGVSLQGS